MNRKLPFLAIATAALLLGSAGAFAGSAGDQQQGHGHDKGSTDNGQDSGDHDGYDEGHGNNPKDQGKHDNGHHGGWDKHAYRRGERLPEHYYSSREYYVTDYQRYNLREPERGYQWVRDDNGQLILIALATGLITDIVLGH